VGSPPGNLGSGEFRYEGTNPAAYSDTFFKETNQDDPNGYADLINLCRVISAPPSGGTAEQPAIADNAYVAAVSALLDIDQFYRFITIDALIGNQEGGLQSGRGDDVSLYRGLVDPRFRFIPHDMDSVFYMGESFGGNRSRARFSATILTVRPAPRRGQECLVSRACSIIRSSHRVITPRCSRG
jgi:spore coat protein CotH